MKKNVKMSKAKNVATIEHALLALPSALYIFVFSYIPMYGVILAFKNFDARLGFFKSPWVGLKNFEFFFKSQDAWRVTRNTLVLNSIFIITSTICAVIFALLMFEVVKQVHIKIYQTIAILPMFISWVIVGYIVYSFLQTDTGVINRCLENFGFKPVSWYSEPNKWPVILTITNIWKNVGFAGIIYYASLIGVSQDYYEAAEIDGANKLQTAWYLSIPSLIPIITILTILSIGAIFRADFGMFYNVTRNIGTLYPTTDVVDTYVFRALTKSGSIGMSAAVGLFQSIVGFVLIIVTNMVVKKIEPDNSIF